MPVEAPQHGAQPHAATPLHPALAPARLGAAPPPRLTVGALEVGAAGLCVGAAVVLCQRLHAVVLPHREQRHFEGGLLDVKYPKQRRLRACACACACVQGSGEMRGGGEDIARQEWAADRPRPRSARCCRRLRLRCRLRLLSLVSLPRHPQRRTWCGVSACPALQTVWSPTSSTTPLLSLVGRPCCRSVGSSVCASGSPYSVSGPASKLRGGGGGGAASRVGPAQGGGTGLR